MSVHLRRHEDVYFIISDSLKIVTGSPLKSGNKEGEKHGSKRTGDSRRRKFQGSMG